MTGKYFAELGETERCIDTRKMKTMIGGARIKEQGKKRELIIRAYMYEGEFHPYLEVQECQWVKNDKGGHDISSCISTGKGYKILNAFSTLLAAKGCTIENCENIEGHEEFGRVIQSNFFCAGL